MATYHKVVVVGATGNLGLSVVNALLRHKFEVIAITFNNPEDPKYSNLKTKGVKVIQAHTAISTGPFFDWGLQVGFFQFNLKTHEAVFYDEGKAHVTFSLIDDIGLWVALALQHSEKTENRYLQLGTFVATQIEIFEALEKVSGEKWHVKAHKSTAESKELGEISACQR